MPPYLLMKPQYFIMTKSAESHACCSLWHYCHPPYTYKRLSYIYQCYVQLGASSAGNTLSDMGHNGGGNIQGWGWLQRFPPFLFLYFFSNYQNIREITFIFDRCHRSLAAVTPVKYEVIQRIQQVILENYYITHLSDPHPRPSVWITMFMMMMSAVNLQRENGKYERVLYWPDLVFS